MPEPFRIAAAAIVLLGLFGLALSRVARGLDALLSFVERLSAFRRAGGKRD
jgi:hypothetical protein